MSDRSKFWCHGVDVHVQDEPDQAISVRRNSQGTRVRQDSGSNWFHFAIPTATQLVDRDVEIWNAYLNADMNANSTIVAVHIYMGAKPEATRIHEVNSVTWSNRHPLNASFDVRNRKIIAPLVMCIKVEFERGGEITFCGAGAQIVGPEHGG